MPNTPTKIVTFNETIGLFLSASLFADGLLQVSETYDSQVLAEAHSVADEVLARATLIRTFGEVGRLIPLQVEGKDFAL